MDEILKELFPGKKKGYRELWTELEIHPKIARLRLDALIEKGLIKEEGRENWKQGKKLLYSLTDRGREECIDSAINDLNEGFKIVEEILTEILDNPPSKFKEWKEASRKRIFETKITEEMPLDERIRRLSVISEKIYGPLEKSYKNVHNLICRLTLPPELAELGYFIGFTKKGGLCLIPIGILREKGFDFI